MDRFIRNTAPDYYEGAEDLSPQFAEQFQLILNRHDANYPANSTDSIDSSGNRLADFSIYLGCAGNLYLYWKLSQNSGIYDQKLTQALGASLRAIENETRIDTISFLMGQTGIWSLQAVINRDRLALAKVLECERHAYIKKAEDELLYGNAGYLYCLLFISKHWSSNPLKQEIADAVRRTCEILIKTGNRNGELHFSFPRGSNAYLGAGHGTIGIIHILLQAREYIGNTYDIILNASIVAVLNQQFNSGNFPVIEDEDEDKLIHFCHGAAGAVPMLCLAFTIFHNSLYLDRAIKAANCIWTKGLLKKGSGICHGISGNAYAFLSLYKTTRKRKWIFRAQIFAYKMLLDPETMEEIRTFNDPQRQNIGIPDSPYSLMEGDAGTLCFINDLLNAENSSYPCYDV